MRKPGRQRPPGMASTVTNRLEGTVMAIKAVVFDIGGVLEQVEDDTWPQVWIGRWARRMNLVVGDVMAELANEPAGNATTGEHVEAARACGWYAVWHRDTTRSILEVREIIRAA